MKNGYEIALACFYNDVVKFHGVLWLAAYIPSILFLADDLRGVGAFFAL